MSFQEGVRFILDLFMRYVVVHLKSEKDKYLGTNGVNIRVDMEIYLQHGLQQKCAGLVSAGCSQRDDMNSNSVF